MLAMSESHTFSRSAKGIGPIFPASFESSDFDYVADWRTLECGDGVVVSNESAFPVRGIVDAITSDGEIVWIHGDNGSGRQLFTRLEGHKLWRSVAGQP